MATSTSALRAREWPEQRHVGDREVIDDVARVDDAGHERLEVDLPQRQVLEPVDSGRSVFCPMNHAVKSATTMSADKMTLKICDLVSAEPKVPTPSAADPSNNSRGSRPTREPQLILPATSTIAGMNDDASQHEREEHQRREELADHDLEVPHRRREQEVHCADLALGGEQAHRDEHGRDHGSRSSCRRTATARPTSAGPCRTRAPACLNKDALHEQDGGDDDVPEPGAEITPQLRGGQ